MEKKGIITEAEIALCKECIEMGRAVGAQAMRVSLSKGIQNSIAVLDNEIDTITYNEDRSIFLNIFVDGRYGTYSTNRLDRDQLEVFIRQSIDTTRLLALDECRRLPAPSHKASACTEGDELGLLDSEYFNISQDRKIEMVLKAASHSKLAEIYNIDSVESEYSDSMDDNYMVDSDGFEGRHIETSYGFCTEATIEDAEGCKYSGYHWTGAPFFKNFAPEDVTATAIEEAAAQMNPRTITSGRKTVVVHFKTASRLLGPVLSAINGNAIQQKVSFLCDTLGRKVFSDKMSVIDLPHAKGCPGARLFDTEGVATQDGPIIENGIVRKYFVNTYCAAKTGLEPTVEAPSHLRMTPFICNSAKKEINLTDILANCGSGILVTGFNGGNCNNATGDFSFGIEGFVFEDGKIVYPFEEALMTGNMVDLWNNLRAVGSDVRTCTRWHIPSLAFDNIDINA